jgi:hypothetical protein
MQFPKNYFQRKEEVESSIFAFHDEVTLVSYVPKENRTGTALSTEHHDSKVEVKK